MSTGTLGTAFRWFNEENISEDVQIEILDRMEDGESLEDIQIAYDKAQYPDF